MADKTWKALERKYAKWFDTTRNPLSGRNNRNDDGSKRLGDNLYKPALIELKTRRRIATLDRASETRDLANAHNIPWLHIEHSTRRRGMVALVLPEVFAETVVRNFLRPMWEGRMTEERLRVLLHSQPSQPSSEPSPGAPGGDPPSPAPCPSPPKPSP